MARVIAGITVLAGIPFQGRGRGMEGMGVCLATVRICWG